MARGQLQVAPLPHGDNGGNGLGSTPSAISHVPSWQSDVYTSYACLGRQHSGRTGWSQFLPPCRLKAVDLWKSSQQRLGSLRVVCLYVPGYTDTAVTGCEAESGA